MSRPYPDVVVDKGIAQMFQQRRQKSTLKGLLLFRFWITSLVK